MQIKTKIVSCDTADSKPVKQEVNCTEILPPLVFPLPKRASLENLGINYDRKKVLKCKPRGGLLNKVRNEKNIGAGIFVRHDFKSNDVLYILDSVVSKGSFTLATK